MSSLIGNRYGEAFFEAGRDENCLDSLYDDVCLLRSVLGENEDFLKVMNVPSVAKEERPGCWTPFLMGISSRSPSTICTCWWIKAVLAPCRIRWKSL